MDQVTQFRGDEFIVTADKEMPHLIIEMPKAEYKLSDFKCQCNYRSCRKTVINKKLLQQFKKFLADIHGMNTLVITSAYRCERHNEYVGGNVYSQHTLGCALDVTGLEATRRSKEDMEMIIPFARLYFDYCYIGGPTTKGEYFLHVDVRDR